MVELKKLYKIEEIDVKDKTVYDIELEKNHYFAANNIVSHNCRLRNKIHTKEFSFTNGNIGVMIGSKSVITLNVSRIVQDWDRMYHIGRDCSWKNNKASLKEYLSNILERVYMYHNAYNELLWDEYNSKLLPVYDAGFIALDKQYLTIGVNGLNQAAEYLGMRCSDNHDYMEFCQFWLGTIQELNSSHGSKHLKFNTEIVPGESLGVKFAKWDKEDGYWVPEDTNLYASYIFKPNDPTLSVLEKVRMHGRNYTGEFTDGGQSCHLNLTDHPSVEQCWKLLNYAAEQGCQYYSINVPMSECQDCGHIVNIPADKCPRCGSTNITYWTRIIGYLTAVTSWSKERRKEFSTRIFHNDNHSLEYQTYEQKSVQKSC